MGQRRLPRRFPKCPVPYGAASGWAKSRGRVREHCPGDFLQTFGLRTALVPLPATGSGILAKLSMCRSDPLHKPSSNHGTQLWASLSASGQGHVGRPLTVPPLRGCRRPWLQARGHCLLLQRKAARPCQADCGVRFVPDPNCGARLDPELWLSPLHAPSSPRLLRYGTPWSPGRRSYRGTRFHLGQEGGDRTRGSPWPADMLQPFSLS